MSIVKQSICLRLRHKKVGLAVILIHIQGKEFKFDRIRTLVKKTLKTARVAHNRMPAKDVSACLHYALCVKFDLADKKVVVEFTYGERR